MPFSNLIPTFGNRCLSVIGGGKQRSRLAGWVQLSAEAAPSPHGVLYIEDNPKNNVMVCGNFTSSFDQLCNFAI